jgi:hypothetical protein
MCVGRVVYSVLWAELEEEDVQRGYITKPYRGGGPAEPLNIARTLPKEFVHLVNHPWISPTLTPPMNLPRLLIHEEHRLKCVEPLPSACKKMQRTLYSCMQIAVRYVLRESLNTSLV